MVAATTTTTITTTSSTTTTESKKELLLHCEQNNNNEQQKEQEEQYDEDNNEDNKKKNNKNKKNDYYCGFKSPATSDDYYSMEQLEELYDKDWLNKLGGEWKNNKKNTMMKKVMDPLYDTYHPYACHLCKRSNDVTQTTLLTCTQCKVVKYCCKEHQKQDWKKHKLFCMGFKSLTDKMLKQDYDNIIDWRHQSHYQSLAIVNSLQIDRMFGKVVMMQPRCRICYDAAVDNTKLIICPKCNGVAVCQKCYHQKKNKNSNSNHNSQQSDDNDDETHIFHPNPGGGGDDGGAGGNIAECNGHLLSLCCSGMIVEHGCPLQAISDNSRDDDDDSSKSSYHMIQDWHDYFHVKPLLSKFTQSGVPQDQLRTAPIVAFITDGLSLPLTAYHIWTQTVLLSKTNNNNDTAAMTDTNKNKNKRNRKQQQQQQQNRGGGAVPRNVIPSRRGSSTRFVLHLLNATPMDFASYKCYMEIIRMNPTIKYFRIIMFGTQLPMDDIEAERGITFNDDIKNNMMDKFQRSISSQCDAKVMIRCGLYHDAIKTLSNEEAKPDLILAQHPCIYGNQGQWNNWKKTIDYIMSMKADDNDDDDMIDVPFCYTGYNQQDVQKDRDTIDNLYASSSSSSSSSEPPFEFIIPPTPNPFRGLRPILDPARDPSDFIYNHSSFAVLKKKKNNNNDRRPTTTLKKTFV